jgi:hypothetical protein
VCLLNNLSKCDDLSILHLNHMLQVWGKTGAKLYGPTTGTDYRDNQLRFCLLCLVSNPVYLHFHMLSKPMHYLPNLRFALSNPWQLLIFCTPRNPCYCRFFFFCKLCCMMHLNKNYWMEFGYLLLKRLALHIFLLQPLQTK